MTRDEVYEEFLKSPLGQRYLSNNKRLDILKTRIDNDLQECKEIQKDQYKVLDEIRAMMRS